MKLFLRHKGLVSAIAAAALVLILSIVSLASGQGATPLSNILGTVFSPLQSLAAGVSGGIENIYSAMREIDKLREENSRMREKIARYEEETRDYRKTAEENERLKELLGLKERKPDLKFEQTDIIARDLSNWASTLTLGKGSGVGISVGNCVVSAEGYFIGVVKEVGINWCVVNTAADTDTSIGVIFDRTGITAVAEGDFSLMKKGQFKVSLLSPDADIRQGDIILTSGIGGMYPKDIAIGTVEDFQAEATGISSCAIIKPLADLEHITQAFVIVSFDEESE